eukprot:COSAG03_NODE_4588_length_1499_cov_2.234286_1_plen_283_part_10
MASGPYNRGSDGRYASRSSSSRSYRKSSGAPGTAVKGARKPGRGLGGARPGKGRAAPTPPRLLTQQLTPLAGWDLSSSWKTTPHVDSDDESDSSVSTLSVPALTDDTGTTDTSGDDLTEPQQLTPLTGWDLYGACILGKAELVQRHLDQGGDPNLRGPRAGIGQTGLHGAVLGNQPRMVPFLVSRGTDVDATDSNGYTALHAAAWSDSADCVRALLDENADTSIQNDAGQTALQLAQSMANAAVVALLQQAPGGKGEGAEAVPTAVPEQPTPSEPAQVRFDET